MIQRSMLAVVALAWVACGPTALPRALQTVATREALTSAFTSPTRYSHDDSNLVMLHDGRVLVADSTGEIFDPTTGLWTLTGPLNEPRYYATMVRLNDGRVLAAGGHIRKTAELFDPVTNAWTPTQSMSTDREPFPSCVEAKRRSALCGRPAFLRAGATFPSGRARIPTTRSSSGTSR